MTKILDIEALEAHLRRVASRLILCERVPEGTSSYDLFGGDGGYEAYDMGMDDGHIRECRHILKTFFDAEGE